MKLKFSIISGVNRPIIYYNRMRFLFDTGASTPVWCRGEKAFCKKFPEATKQDFKYLLSGFGRIEQEMLILKGASNVKLEEFLTPVYKIPSFYFSNGTHAMRWINLHVAVTRKESIGVDFILTSTMFKKMGLYWSQEDEKEPYIEISSDIATKQMYVLRYFNEDLAQELLGSIYAQDYAEFENTKRKLPSKARNSNAFFE